MKIVTGSEMKKLDALAMEKYGVPGILLMENAAKAVADTVMELLEEMSYPYPRVAVVCGKGNNGGDGFGAARWLKLYGVDVNVLLVGCTAEEVAGDAKLELEMLVKAGAKVTTILNADDMILAEVACLKADLLIDALLGTGFSGELRSPYKEMCQLLNNSRAEVVAIDIPSGVNAEDGSADADAINAAVTVTMELPKLGLLLEPGHKLAGRIHVCRIGMPDNLLEETASKTYLLDQDIVEELLPVRNEEAHKGDAGRVLLCAGSPGYVGAAALASRAAVKAGAGLVSLATPLSSREVLAVKLDEVMVHGLLERMPGVIGGGALSDLLKRAEEADVVAVGPGLGTSESTMQVVRDLLAQMETPVVIDADALTALQGHTDILAKMQAPKVLTPHPGEMARLTGLSVEEINVNRFALAVKYAQAWNAVVVLKGAATAIGCPDGSLYICNSGCSALATGGTGDVLTGIIAGLAAQSITLTEAALCGVYLHGVAGSVATEGAPGLAAGELADCLPELRANIAEYAVIEEDSVYNNALKVIK